MIVTQHVKTKTMEVDGVPFNGTLHSAYGDIGYHFELEDDAEIYKEGEVIGLVLDESKNKQTISKLTAKNSGSVVLKGVITRSQYFEAQKPEPGGRWCFFNFFKFFLKILI